MASQARRLLLLQDTFLWRTFLIAGGTGICTEGMARRQRERSEGANAMERKSGGATRSPLRRAKRFWWDQQQPVLSQHASNIGTVAPWSSIWSSLVAPSVTLTEGRTTTSLGKSQQQQQMSSSPKQEDADRNKVYDFVVIGYGNAGRSAVETLQQECPSASIALLDPLRRPSSAKIGTSSTRLDYFASRAVGLSPQKQLVETDHDDDDDDDAAGNGTLQYNYAVLIATGARGAVPPSYLMDNKSREHIFELRPTILPTTVVGNDKDSDDDGQQHQREEENHQRPVMSAEDVRQTVLRLAKDGASVGVLGCGFDAVDLVVEASLMGSSNNRNMKRNRPVMIFGSHGPVNHALPNYLCAALAKRLKAKRIDLLDRSLIRYVSHNDDEAKHSSSKKRQPAPSLNVYTAKSFDFLDGRTTSLDVLVLAPDVSGPRGTGVMPTNEVPEFLEDTAKGRSWYQTWSGLSVLSQDDPSMIVCYKDDGRIAVNPELCACTGVYAAGSVAKYANSVTGHATVAGAGVADGTAGGRTAALNMSRLVESRSSSSSRFGFGAREGRKSKTTVAVKEPLPVWRSDLRYSSAQEGVPTEATSLSQIGITALCVGNCDAESMSTHGVWWSNHSAFRRRLTQRSRQDEEEEGDGDDDGSPESLRRKQQRQRQRREILKSLKPVYGLGVIYYLDSTGHIHGLMTWGLPFTRSENDRELNQQLIEQMRTVIRTNGGIRCLDTEADHLKMAQYLGDTSKQLVATALTSGHGEHFAKAHQLQLDRDEFPRPLHRYTEVRPPSVRSVGVLKRRDGLHGNGILGEDMFARYEEHDDHRPDPPPPKPIRHQATTTATTTTTTVAAGGSAATANDASSSQAAAAASAAWEAAQARYHWAVWDQKERRWDANEARARPPKEEPLWIRKGDETRNIPQRERIGSAYKTAMNV